MPAKLGPISCPHQKVLGRSSGDTQGPPASPAQMNWPPFTWHSQGRESDRPL